jgi:hypothetical protein
VKSDDEAVSQAIVALTDATGRKDAVALAARGNALLTLKRGAEAVQAFHAARALSSGLPGMDAALAAAEELARGEVPKSALAAAVRSAEPDPAAPVTASARGSRPEQAASPPAVETAESMLALQPTRTYSNHDPATRSH